MRFPVLLLAAALISSSSVEAFNQGEFKKCADSAFCQRLRGAKHEPQYAVQPASVIASVAGILARLLDPATGTELVLTVSAFEGTLRIHVDEPGAGRFQVADVLTTGLDTVSLTGLVTTQTGCSFSLGAADVSLAFSPFQASVHAAGAEIVSLNSRSMFAFEHRREKQEGDPAGWWEESFKTHRDSKPKGPQGVSFDVSFPAFDHLYGLPERATALALKPTLGEGVDSEPYRLYNLDVFEYLADSPFGLYGSIPLMLAHNDNSTVGVFWLNAAEMYVDVEANPEGGMRTQWFAESGVLDLFVLLGPTPEAVSRQYGILTGTTAMPQMFSIGYHQCRWNYRDEADVSAVNTGFDDAAMPCDVIWLDIEHTDGKRYMTWDSGTFPSPVRMQEEVAASGRKMVTIVDPHVKRDTAFAMHSQATSKGYYVKDRNGKDFEGWCWPGSSSYLDMLDPAIRGWWADQFSLATYKGSTDNLYIWNDMNEPSVFNGPEITMHKDSLHFGGQEHRDVHNLYGYFYHMATADGLRRRGYTRDPDHGDRPFVLSRAFFAGTQRVGPIWTGDNGATWEQLRVSLPMLLSLNIAGLSNVGADVGGFFGNPGEQLLLRWYQTAIFSPFFRGHAHLDTARREPWLFGGETSDLIRDAMRERYALLPYLYTQFRTANTTGLPILRPMWYTFPRETSLFAEDQQMMFGPALLVAPVLHEDATHVDVKLPTSERWFDATTGAEVYPDTGNFVHHLRAPVTLSSIPRYYRGGHILPRRERPRRNTASQAEDPYTLVVVLDKAFGAQGSLYVDDGRSFAFLKGQYIEADISYGIQELTYAVKHQGLESKVEFERIVIIGAPEGRLVAGVPGKRGSRMLDIAWGPLHLGQTDSSVLVIRQPGVTIGSSWSIQVSYSD